MNNKTENMKPQWIPLSAIKDNEKIWSGSRVRLYNVGLNVANKSENYYEYIVSDIYANSQFLQLTCLSQGEGGNIICVLEKDKQNHYALGKELKYKMGMENTFLYKE